MANVAELRRNLYDAINMYNNNVKHKLLKLYYENVYVKYKEAGGKESLEYFENTIDEYNIQGICGY